MSTFRFLRLNSGSGKTTFMSRVNSELHASKEPPYIINLDPAVLDTPYGCNIDIRDAVDYAEVKQQYNLGPNGAILTSLNLFATKIDQLVTIIEKRVADPDRKPPKYIFIDTRK